MNTVVTGTTTSGKSTAKAQDVIRELEEGETAIVALDPHRRSLVWWMFTWIVALALEKRVIFDRLSELKCAPGYRLLEPSKARDELQRWGENKERVGGFTELLCRRTGIGSLEKNPVKEEWVTWALRVFISQDRDVPLSDLPAVFSPKDKRYGQFLDHSQDEEAAERIRGISTGAVKAGVYLPAERLIRGTFDSPQFQLRGGQTFRLDGFLGKGGILLVEGGSTGSVSFDAMRVVLGALIQKVIQYVRNRREPKPRIHLIVDEAGNAGLVGMYECRALGELQKGGLDITLLDQTCFSGNPTIQKAVLQNCMRHEWMYCGDASLAKLGASDLRNPNLAEELMTLPRGVRWVKQHREVWKETVKRLENPWHFPGLQHSKAEQALRQIQERPEYRSGSEITSESEESQESTPSQQKSSKFFSPASLLRTERSDQ